MIAAPNIGSRREAREDALALLYEAELVGGTCKEALARRAVPPSDYAVEIALGLDADRAQVDDVLGRHLVGWRVERMAVVDRSVARIAVWELMCSADVPTGAILSEAVALATQYCSAESPRFLNGVLSAAATDLRSDPSPPNS